MFTNISKRICTMILDYIFRKGFRSSYLRSFAEEKIIICRIFDSPKNCIRSFFLSRFSQMWNLRCNALECEVNMSRKCGHVSIFSKFISFALFTVVQRLQTRCLHLVVLYFLLCCVFVFILLGLDIVVVFCSLFPFIQHLENCYILIWKTKCTDNI